MVRPLIFLHVFCIGGILATSITHGFTRRRPARSLQIPPESGICPTDFTDLHRFFVGGFGHADFADDADFFSSGIFIHRISQIYTDFSCFNFLPFHLFPPFSFLTSYFSLLTSLSLFTFLPLKSLFTFLLFYFFTFKKAAAKK